MKPCIRWFTTALALAGIVGCLATAADARTVETLDREALKRELRANQALRMQVERTGFPDLAQRWETYSEFPWQTYLVRLIYLDSGKELGFARAYVLGKPAYGVLRYRRPLSDELAAQTRDYLSSNGPAPAVENAAIYDDGNPADRAEHAAVRAENAAVTSERNAERVEQVAQRLEDTAVKAEASFKQGLVKK
jgi:hypothetical protein